MKRLLSVALMVLVSLVGMAMINPVIAQQAPPTSEKAKQIEALVNKAAALIESKGKSIFPEFRNKDTEWFTGDTYLFVYDLKSNVLLNAAFPAARRDQHHRPKRCQWQAIPRTSLFRWLKPKGSGWVDYIGSIF